MKLSMIVENQKFYLTVEVAVARCRSGPYVYDFLY